MTRPTDIEGHVVVAACGITRGIGKDGLMPWPRLQSDLKHFKDLTLNNPVVMGSVTYKSLPKSVRPLPGRLNIVLSSQKRTELALPDSVLIAGSLDAAKELLRSRGLSKVFVIGGEAVYTEALRRPEWSRRVHYTHISNHYECDRFFPCNMDDPKSGFDLVSLSANHEQNGILFCMKEYVRRGDSAPPSKVQTDPQRLHGEQQYLNLVHRILRDGISKGDRTGVGTRSVFGAQMRFDLRESFPLLTTKRVFWRGVVEELLWFIKGSTNANILSEKGVHIWDDNGSREFLDKCGFKDREVGDLGPVYGFQWRHFGADYSDMYADYSGQGVDQLAQVIHTIKTKPNDRRILLSAWNPGAISKMALPPCHVLAQFYVANGELSCQMYQRSCDMGLGVPFNIASYSLLTYLIAAVCDLRPGDFVHVLGDAHVYNNHVEALRLQLKREPRPFPKLIVRKRESIDNFTPEDLELQGYEPHKAIAMKMAV